MANVLLLATAWGPKHGGINAFNMDFAAALAGYLKPSGRVFCAVLDASREDCEGAQAAGVTLASIGKDINASSFDEDWAYRVREKLPPDISVDWWVGHDVTSAEAALKGPQVNMYGRTALMMHMNYADYASYKHGSGAEAVRKERRQRDLFRRADKHFAVGPLLRDALRDMVDGEVTMLVPGFADVPIRPAGNRLTLITFGRMDRESDRIKQGGLAVAGFASAVRLAHQPGMPKTLRDNPQMRVIGISEERGAEEAALRRVANDKAGRELNLMAQPFDEDRAVLFDQLGRANIALMLSWHEGFGLTGWEAIAAEVPLIVSRQSGLYRLVDEALGDPGTACFRMIDVQGQEGNDDTSNFTQPDEDQTRDAILRIVSEVPRAQSNARLLKKLLQEKLVCTWENTARQFCEGLGLKPDEPASPILVTPAPSQPGPRPSGTVVEEKRTDAAETGPPPLIALPERPWRDPLGIEMPDSLMLLPQQEIVPFHSYRQRLLDEVLAWALAEDEPIKVRLQAGEGGTGKTRLAIESCHRLESEHGWRTGLLRASENLETNFGKFLGEGGDCLVVVDYAETRTSNVVALTRAAFKAPTKGKVRLLLLARDGGDWWDRLADSAKDDAAVAALLRQPSTKTGPYRMSQEPIEPEVRSAVFQEALASFAKKRRQDTPSVATPDLSADHFSQILFIHLAALASLRGSPATGDRELLEMAIGHERAYWRHLLDSAGLGEAWLDPLEQAIALLTLLGGADSAKEAKVAIRRTPRLGGTPLSARDQLFDLLRRLYRRGGGLSGLQPDLLGEHLVAAALAHDDEIIDVALEKASTSAQAVNALTVLTRLAKRDQAESRWLARALERHLPVRIDEALEVALETGSPMPEIIATTLRILGPLTQRSLVKSLRLQLPETTVNLRALAIDVAQHDVALLRTQRRGVKGWKAAKQMRDAYHALAVRHHDAGQWKEAAEAEEKALTYAEVMGRYEGAANHAAVAGAKINLAGALVNIGSFESALTHSEQAEMILRRLAERQPDTYRPHWAAALSTLGRCLGDLGRYEQALAKAEQAEAIRGELAAQQPDKYRADLARSLQSIGTVLDRLGRYEQALAKAEQAEVIRRELAAQQPDKYRAAWAESLSSVAIHLDELGDYKEALALNQQAEKICRELATQQPDNYRRGWAATLTNSANYLRNLGRYGEALAMAEQAEAIYRELSERQPDANRPSWGLSLGNLAEIAVRGGLADRALPAARRAVEVLEALAVYPNDDRDHLGFCLRVLAEALLETGDADGALEEAQRGEKIWTTIFAERPAYACEQYGKSLPVLARARLAVEGKAAAVDTLVSGIESISPYFQQRPRALYSVMDGFVRTLREIDAVAGAERVPAELVEQLDELSRDTPRKQTS
jgi:tetratricopeptide (TPR) repeat protein/glycosyltransferase involved in cell wall biosynthesis